jgi:hypothetical protein
MATSMNEFLRIPENESLLKNSSDDETDIEPQISKSSKTKAQNWSFTYFKVT